MEIDGKSLIEGKFYLWEVDKLMTNGKPLHSIYFITEDKKCYEVVFAHPTPENPVPGWYLAEKQIIPEAEVIEINDDPNTLSIRVNDELELGEQLS